MLDLTFCEIVWTILTFLVAFPCLGFVAVGLSVRYIKTSIDANYVWTRKASILTSVSTGVTLSISYAISLGRKWLATEPPYPAAGLAGRMLFVFTLSAIGIFAGVETGRSIFVARES